MLQGYCELTLMKCQIMIAVCDLHSSHGFDWFESEVPLYNQSIGDISAAHPRCAGSGDGTASQLLATRHGVSVSAQTRRHLTRAVIPSKSDDELVQASFAHWDHCHLYTSKYSVSRRLRSG